MFKRVVSIMAVLALCLALTGCLETPTPAAEGGEGESTPVPGMTVVADGSFTAKVVDKADDGLTLEITNSENRNEVSATFTSVKIGGQEYQINQATFSDSPLSIVRVGYDGKTANLRLPANDYARLKVSCSDAHGADSYNNVDLVYSETYMSDNGTVTKTGKTISVKNA